MKQLFVLFLTLNASLIYAQNKQVLSENPRFGAAINSSIDGVVGEICVAPTGLLYIKKHQVELGLCIYPYNLYSPKIIGGNLEYKYFPNEINNRFNLYFHAHLNFTHEFIDHHYINSNYQTTRNYLSLLGGYGFEIRFLRNAYVGTSLSFGVNTSSQFSTNPQEVYQRSLFDFYEMNGAIRLTIGYRF